MRVSGRQASSQAPCSVASRADLKAPWGGPCCSAPHSLLAGRAGIAAQLPVRLLLRPRRHRWLYRHRRLCQVRGGARRDLPASRHVC